MAGSWADRWVGTHGPDGIAALCWWFVREVFLRECGIVLPIDNALAPKDDWARLIDAGQTSGEWRRIDTPRDFDVVLARPVDPGTGVPIADFHVGMIATGAGGSDVVHLHNNRAGVVRHSLARWVIRGGVIGVYRRV